eukprot:IDg8117t1
MGYEKVLSTDLVDYKQAEDPKSEELYDNGAKLSDYINPDYTYGSLEFTSFEERSDASRNTIEAQDNSMISND